MRKQGIYAKYIGILLVTMQPLTAENISGKSFYTAQPFCPIVSDITYTTIMDQHFEDGSVLNRPEIQVSVFGGASINKKALRNAFLFNDKASLSMTEAPENDTSTNQDIIGYNFNIFSANGNATSIITMDPEEKFIGFSLSARCEFLEKWWLAGAIDFKQVSRNLHLSEAKTTTGTVGLNNGLGLDAAPVVTTNMISAFKQPGMHYGKINGEQKKRGCGDMEITLGYDFTDRTTSYFAPFIGVVLPTSNKPTAEYLWEPILGNNGHAGVTLGMYGHSRLFEKNDTNLWFTWSSKSEYLIRNTQKRSFDLKRGPWTRYLAMYANDAKRTSTTQTLGTAGIKTFGINLMTHDVHVSPGWSNYSLINLSLIRNNLNATVGVTTYIRESESIRFAHDWVLGPEVADLINDNNTNVLSDISDLYTSGGAARADYIKFEDIDLGSAASSNLFVGSLYATLNYYNDTNHPQLYEIGGSYETSKQNNAVDRFTVWGKFQLTF